MNFSRLAAEPKSYRLQAVVVYFGVPVEGERARPIQICVWYPAQANGELSEMTYGEYVFPIQRMIDFSIWFPAYRIERLIFFILLHVTIAD